MSLVEHTYMNAAKPRRNRHCGWRHYHGGTAFWLPGFPQFAAHWQRYKVSATGPR